MTRRPGTRRPIKAPGSPVSSGARALATLPTDPFADVLEILDLADEVATYEAVLRYVYAMPEKSASRRKGR